MDIFHYTVLHGPRICSVLVIKIVHLLQVPSFSADVYASNA